MRELVIGDIHGYSRALEGLLDEVKPTQNDRLTFLGDYIDRGPDSRRTLDILMQLSRITHPRFLMGNHERYFLASLEDPTVEALWIGYGGDSMLASFNAVSASDVPDEYIEFLQSLSLRIEDEKYIFVHAGVNPNVDMDRQDEETLLWKHSDQAPWHRSGKIVVSGHSYVSEPELTNLSCRIDTGIARGGWLTCLNLNDYSFVQVNADGFVRKEKFMHG